MLLLIEHPHLLIHSFYKIFFTIILLLFLMSNQDNDNRHYTMVNCEFDLGQFFRDSLNSVTKGISDIIDSVCIYHNKEFVKCPRPLHSIKKYSENNDKEQIKACCEYFALLDCAEAVATKYCDVSAVQNVQQARLEMQQKKECAQSYQLCDGKESSLSTWIVWMLVIVAVVVGSTWGFLYWRHRKNPNTHRNRIQYT